MVRTNRLVAAWMLAAGLAACSSGSDDGGGGAPPGPALSVSPTSVTFAATVAGAALPAAETVAVTNSGGGTLPTPVVTVSYAGAGSGWLNASVAAAGAGYTITLRPNTSALSPATHSASVQVACAGASGSPKVVPVTWQITASATPVITVSPAALGFTGEVGGADPAAKTIAVGNGGGGTLGTLGVTDDAAWLDASIAGTTVTVTVSLAGVTAGQHTANLQVTAANATNSPVIVPVTLSVGVPTLAVAPTSLSFTATPGATPAAKTLSVTNSGAGTLAAPTATPAYTTGTGWMSAAVAGSGNAYTVTVTVTAPGTAGTYGGSVSIASANASNSPVAIPVTLTVTGGGGGDLATLDSAVRTLYGAYFDRLAGCYPYAPWMIASMKAMAAGYATTVAQAEAAGRLGYVRAQAESCATWIAGATCPQLEEAFDLDVGACGAFATGRVANGGGCYAGVECAAGYCTADVLLVCPGQCTAFVPNGNACTDWLQCGSGACDGSVCVADVPGGVGQPCGFGDFACQSGLYCDAGDVCRQRLAAGGDCSAGAQCAAGLACGVDGSCRALAGDGGDCSVAICGDGYYCNSASRCAQVPLLGDSCADLPVCFDGSYCSSALTCVAGTVPVSGTCNHANDLFCRAGGYCSTPVGPGTCIAVPTSACY
jgi:hypothetical protein